MTINLQTGAYTPPPSLPGARSADIQVVQKQQDYTTEAAVPDTTGTPDTDTTVSAEQKRYNKVMAAAQNFVGDVYPVSDKTFVFYKDVSGQYVTRYTSLRDGRVTYIPEQRLLQIFESAQRSLANATAIQA